MSKIGEKIIEALEDVHAWIDGDHKRLVFLLDGTRAEMTFTEYVEWVRRYKEKHA